MASSLGQLQSRVTPSSQISFPKAGTHTPDQLDRRGPTDPIVGSCLLEGKSAGVSHRTTNWSRHLSCISNELFR